MRNVVSAEGPVLLQYFYRVEGGTSSPASEESKYT